METSIKNLSNPQRNFSQDILSPKGQERQLLLLQNQDLKKKEMRKWKGVIQKMLSHENLRVDHFRAPGFNPTGDLALKSRPKLKDNAHNFVKRNKSTRLLSLKNKAKAMKNCSRTNFRNDLLKDKNHLTQVKSFDDQNCPKMPPILSPTPDSQERRKVQLPSLHLMNIEVKNSKDVDKLIENLKSRKKSTRQSHKALFRSKGANSSLSKTNVAFFKKNYKQIPPIELLNHKRRSRRIELIKPPSKKQRSELKKAAERSRKKILEEEEAFSETVEENCPKINLIPSTASPKKNKAKISRKFTTNPSEKGMSEKIPLIRKNTNIDKDKFLRDGATIRFGVSPLESSPPQSNSKKRSSITKSSLLNRDSFKKSKSRRNSICKSSLRRNDEKTKSFNLSKNEQSSQADTMYLNNLWRSQRRESTILGLKSGPQLHYPMSPKHNLTPISNFLQVSSPLYHKNTRTKERSKSAANIRWIRKIKNEMENLKKKIGQANVSQLNVMRKHAQMELQFCDENQINSEISDLISKMLFDVKKNIPQVRKEACLLGVKFTYYSYKLKPRTLMNFNLRKKMFDYTNELQGLSNRVQDLTLKNHISKGAAQPRLTRKCRKGYKELNITQKIQKNDIGFVNSIHTELKEINGIQCMIQARLMSSKICVELSTTLDETEWVIKPEVHSDYLKTEYEKLNKSHIQKRLVNNKTGHFKLEYYPLVKNCEDIDFHDEISRLYFTCSNQEQTPGIISLNYTKTLEEAMNIHHYIVRLKGSHMFSQDRENIYMSVQVDETPNEYKFTVEGLNKIKKGEQQGVIKNLLRLPSKQLNVSTIFQKARIRRMNQDNFVDYQKSKRFEEDTLILTKKLVQKRLAIQSRDEDDIKFFIEEELFLCNKLKRGNEGGLPTTEYTYRLELIKDVEMLNENNYRKNILLTPHTMKEKSMVNSQFEESISRVDEFDSSSDTNFNVVYEEQQPTVKVTNKFDNMSSTHKSKSDYGQFLDTNTPKIPPRSLSRNKNIQKNRSQRSISIRKSLIKLHSGEISSSSQFSKKRLPRNSEL
ncbi:unnamed protein product [Moneuplotes crassus]|uniref:Uncharacterized protein n=1 Tax=Euplotes crassus TaxID=5936 RepID=A0AAD1USS0_EUPCR|nr:unnamed protein product [Moneuplotes crassus]